MPHALLVNDKSGSLDLPALERQLNGCGIEHRRYAIGDCDGALADRPQRLIVVGGDGSIAPVAAAAARAQIPLGVIPAGTANDFARAVGLPQDQDAAFQIAMHGSELRALDLAWAGDVPFVNVASTGLAVRAARRADIWKGRLGPLSYVLGALQAAWSARPLTFDIGLDGEDFFRGRAWQVIVANSGAFGWGASVEATVGDDELDVLVLTAGSKWWFPVRAVGLQLGRISHQSGVLHAAAGRVSVLGPDPATWNIDGDVRQIEPVFRVEPAAFQLVVG